MEKVKSINLIKKKSVDVQANVFANNFFMLKLAWKICPKRVIADLFVSAISYFSWIFSSVLFIKYILSSIETNKSFNHIVLFVIGTIIMFAFLEFYNKWYNLSFKPLSDNIISAKLYKMLFVKAEEVELACYEDSQFYNNYTLAIQEADSRVFSVLSNIFNILFAIIAAMAVFINMFMLDKYVSLFVVSPLIGNFLFGKLANKIVYKRDIDSTAFKRKMDYVNRTLYLQNYAKEIRLSSIFDVLKNIYEEGYIGIIDIIKRYYKMATVTEFFRNIFTFLVIFQGVLLYSAYRTMISKTMTLSSFAVLTSAMVSASWILIGLSNNIVTTYQNSIYIENLRKFLNYESKIPENQNGKTLDEEIKCLEFKNINFFYKGQEKPNLEGINIKIGHKEKIAMVGHNGAGKTTLIKLLMRLYDPDEGEILANNINIKEFNLKEYRKLFGTAFQDYQVFSMTVAENVLMKELETEEEEEIVVESLKESGVYEKVMSLDNNINTILTREFDNDGAVLSGGELQKIAVARAFAKDFQIAIFDEPSSALDPISEYRLYESIMKACEDKTVIFISHRLSTATLADKIYLLEDGRVIEEGTHKELIQKQGKYADMFTKQAEKYIEEFID
jgi:ABC-type multidrug transport system, ATPase and permease components